MVIATNQDKFTNDVLESEVPVLVDFWATWCGPCRAMAPVLDKFSQDWPQDIKVMKVDVDANPELAQQYGIMSIPTMVLFEDGQETKRHVGTAPTELLEHLFVNIQPHHH